MGVKRMAKKIVKVKGYYRHHYGKRRWVTKHTRGHRRSIKLPRRPHMYKAGRPTGRTIHKYNRNLDKGMSAKRIRRKHGEAKWRGDKGGSRI